MSCCGRCFPCKRTSRMPERLYSFMPIEVLMRYRASSILTLVSLMKHSRQLLLSKRDYNAPSCSGLICSSLAFASGSFDPAVSLRPVRQCKPERSSLRRTLTCQKQLVEATSRALDVPPSRMCVISLDRDHPWELAEYGGVRVIM